MNPDFSAKNHGSIFLLRSLRDSAKAWTTDHIAITDETQFWGTAIVDGCPCQHLELTLRLMKSSVKVEGM